MSDRGVRDAIQQITGTHLADKVYAIDARIVSVDVGARTCVVIVMSGRSYSTIVDVRLMSSVDDGLLIIPEVDSSVCVIVSDHTDPYISQYSGIDKIVLRGGDLGGLVRVIDLTLKLNNLENKLNDLITKYNTHTHNVTAVGSPTGPNTSQETGQLTLTKRADIENELITHG